MKQIFFVENATKIVQSYFGAGDSKLAATMYRYSVGMSQIYATVSDDGCIPLIYEATGTNADGGPCNYIYVHCKSYTIYVPSIIIIKNNNYTKKNKNKNPRENTVIKTIVTFEAFYS